VARAAAGHKLPRPEADDVASGWEALGQWGDDVARIEPLARGVANDVWSVRVHGHLAVGRLGARSDADLAWETELLQHLDREGLTVPMPTTDGRLFTDGLVVMTYVEGGPPETEADWGRVADTLRRLHRLTQGWPQRPGWRSSTDLPHAETGTKIDLGARARALLDAEQRGRGSSDVGHASSTATPTIRVTSA
jgi:Ser/Thr protein kinase RdoA (MazF antagonist)